jgi:quercetin dioxygenase-like cupin family protein
VAQAGDVLQVPGFERLTVRTASIASGGELLELEAVYAPKGRMPPEHFHPAQEERFDALEGSVRVRLDGDERELRAGQTLVVPPRAPHTFWNPGAEPARLLWQVRPALRTAEFFETLSALPGPPGPLVGALLAREYRDVFRLTRPPAALQGALFGALAAIARLTGRRLPAPSER